MRIRIPVTLVSRRSAALLFLLPALACSDGGRITGPGPITDPQAQVVVSGRGVVASASQLATAVGAEVLAAGGNAVDAAVATAFALAVAEPTMSGLGGRTSIVIRDRAGAVHGIDGLNQVPHGFESGAPAGYSQAAIPGTPAALARALAEHGSWSLAAVLMPAIRLAEQGFGMPPGEASRLAAVRTDLLGHEASARYFLRPDGSAYAADEHFVQADLGRALRAIATHGIDVFYHGWIADSIHADMTANGGFITRAELAQYEALPAIAARGSYRGFEVASNFRPASGHAVVQALHMLEEFDVYGPDHPVEWGALIGEAMRIALGDRGRSFGSAEESAAVLTSRAWARERVAAMAFPPQPLGAEASAAQHAAVAVPAAFDDEPWLATDPESTTHLSVADASGMAVAITQSVGPAAGTRLAASGVGFLYATRLSSTPGSRPSSTISPTLLLHPDGRVALALGAAGDARIISAVIQTIARWADHGLPIDQAVAAPRLHPLGSDELRVESARWSANQRDSLAALGFTVSTAAATWFGRVHALSFDPGTSLFAAVADPRRDGSAAAPGG
jgi:gamma-glutamyltranspeptidase / glutathione hydrolase